MKKMAIITSGFAPVPAIKGGAVEALTTLLLNQNEEQHLFNIDLYTIADKGLDDLDYQYTKIIQIPVNRIEHFVERIINKIFRAIKANKNLFFFEKKIQFRVDKKSEYEYVLFENAMSLFIPVYKWLGNKPKYIFHMHNDFNFDSKSPKMGIEIASKAYKILSVSRYLNNRFIGVTNCGREKCSVLYNCKKPEILHFDEADLDDIKNKCHINVNDFVFLYVGRINEEKGVLELAKAFNRCSGDVKLIICGGTWGTEFRNNRYLNRVIEAIGDKGYQTTFVGYVDEINIRKYYALADCVVIPTVCQEAYGMVMLESLSYGIPIIATRSGGMPEIALNSEVDWIDIDCNIVGNLSDALMDNYKNKDIKKKRALAASNRIKNELQFNAYGYLNRFCEEINYYEC